MGGEDITTFGNNIVDISTGKIYIEKVTGDISITSVRLFYIIKNGQLEVDCKVITSPKPGAITQQDNCILLNAPNSTRALYSTYEKIDLSEYRMITLDYMITNTYSETDFYSFDNYGTVGVWIRNTDKSTADGNSAASNGIIKSVGTSGKNNYPIKVRKQVKFDISDMEEPAYINFNVHRCKIELYNAILE